MIVEDTIQGNNSPDINVYVNLGNHIVTELYHIYFPQQMALYTVKQSTTTASKKQSDK